MLSYLANRIWRPIICRAACKRFCSAKEIHRKKLTILQNVDALYWKLAREPAGRGSAPCAFVKACYCVFNATPIEKYESFRQYLHKCIEEDSSGDWTLLAQTLMEIMMDFLAMKKQKNVVSHMAVPDEFHLGAAAEEFARRIHQACRGELEKPIERAAHDEFFVKVIENGLGYFCSKLMDSSRDGIESLAERVLIRLAAMINSRGRSSFSSSCKAPWCTAFCGLARGHRGKSRKTKNHADAEPVTGLCARTPAVSRLPAVADLPKRDSSPLS